MEAEPYSNREIEGMFSGVHEKLDSILMQTTKTNGKVADIQRWRERANGMAVVLMIVTLPIISWALLKVADLEQTIRSEVEYSISATLSNYEFEAVK
jgi:hypothetical protein